MVVGGTGKELDMVAGRGKVGAVVAQGGEALVVVVAKRSTKVAVADAWCSGRVMAGRGTAAVVMLRVGGGAAVVIVKRVAAGARLDICNTTTVTQGQHS